MTERCVDANVAIKWVIASEGDRDNALALLRDSLQTGIVLIAPPLFPAEVDSIIRKRVYNGSLTAEEGVQAYSVLDTLPVVVVDEPGLRRRSREIAEQFNQRLVYDSLYAALADIRHCAFRTADTRFHRVVKADLSFVRHITEFTLTNSLHP